ncbi:unnamed protein product [Adineta steineri]|uniref:TIR domain-containing protein n=1 Tax=Adineta steineri TaxID=433720 RepID=A0A815I509_9BILA|nr:unnamed protein product [Adineta steineri]
MATSGKKHVMLSYQWDKKSTVLEIYDNLSAQGYAVWMDVKGGMRENLQVSMADGVENSCAVVCFLTQAYQDSKNCRKEFTYAEELGKTIIPVYMESKWKPSSWLGVNLAGALYIKGSSLNSTISTATVLKNPITTNEISTQSQIKQEPKNKYQQSGITVAGGNGKGHELNQLSQPRGMFIDNDKSIFIADYENHRIVKWKLNSNIGEIIAGGNGKGKQNTQLNQPVDLIFDKETNSFIISDNGNGRVIRYFDQNPTKQQTLIPLIYCSGLAIDKNGSVYVSDWQNHQIRRQKREDAKVGELVAGGNGQGNRLNQLNEPRNIFIDEDYSLYISDEKNHRVMKWKKDAKVGELVAGGNGQGNSLKQLSHPQGVVVDHLGQIYVADERNHRVVRWCEGDDEGEIVVGGNGFGTQSNQLNYPRGLSFDNEENLYVVDQNNHRIQKYEKI